MPFDDCCPRQIQDWSKLMLLDTPRIRSRLDLLDLMTHEFGTRYDIDQILHPLLSATVASVGACDASLVLFDANGEPEHFFLINDFEVQKRNRPFSAAILAQGLVAWAKTHREGVLVKDTQADERWYRDESEAPASRSRSAIAVPIQLPEQLMGVLTITATAPDYFDKSDLIMLRIMADQAALAVANARLFRVEQRRHRLADTLASVARAINSPLDLDEILALILEQLALVVDYDSSSISLLEHNILSVQAIRGYLDRPDALQVTLPVSQNVPHYRVLQQKKPILINDMDTEPSWIKTSSFRKVRSWIGVPLLVRDEVIGILTVASHEVNKYTDENVKEVTAFADQAATAVTSAQLVRLRKMRDSYAALFEDSADMIVITDYQDRILDVNRKACQILRRTKETLIGSDISLIDGRLSSHLAEHSKDLQARREVSLEIDIVDPYGEPISLEMNARPVQFESQAGVQWVGRDISARKRSEKMRQDLTDMLVHDLRGPMANLIILVEFLSIELGSTITDPEIHKILELAQVNGRVTRDLLDSMLDVGRLEAGEIYLQQSWVDLNETIQAVKAQVTPQARAKQMELIFRPLPQTPTIWIDRGMIRRVLVNLVDNAIKYTPDQGIVSLTTTISDAAVCFAITDTGPGIGQADQARIFDKFSRVNHSSHAPAGVGLGLAFCKLAVEAHGGAIWVESEGVSGQGSTFFVTIPLSASPEE
jgi:PAS domain S-box-containing protein